MRHSEALAVVHIYEVHATLNEAQTALRRIYRREPTRLEIRCRVNRNWRDLRGRLKHGFHRSLHDRFWEKVDARGPKECWPWLAGIHHKGYGAFQTSKGQTPAQRIAWELGNGRAMRDDAFGCHTCDQPLCCNPAHIWEGSNSENLADCARKGRLGYLGRKTSKLNVAAVHEIRRRRSQGELTTSLARAFDVCTSTISNIMTGKTWSHVS